MQNNSWLERDLRWLKKNWKNVKFHEEEGYYSLELESGRHVSVRVKARLEDVAHDKFKIKDTSWSVGLFDPRGYFTEFSIDMSKWIFPCWWEHYQSYEGTFYTREDCAEIADFMLGVWSAMYFANVEAFGNFYAAWLAGINTGK